jgi:hypothetical protein
MKSQGTQSSATRKRAWPRGIVTLQDTIGVQVIEFANIAGLIHDRGLVGGAGEKYHTSVVRREWMVKMLQAYTEKIGNAPLFGD